MKARDDSDFHGVQIFRARRALSRLQQARLQRCGGKDFQIVAADFGVGVFAGDDFALFGDPDLAVHGAARLRENGVVARAAATSHRTAAAVKQAQPHMMALEHLNEADLGFVKLPSGCDESAVLVAVGIAEHHLLHAAAAIHQRPIFRERQHPVHDAGAGLQILDGLEQRHDVDGAVACGVDQVGFLQQQRDLEQVGNALAHRDDALRDRAGAKQAVRLRRGMEHRQFAHRLIAVGDKWRRQRPRVAQFAHQHSIRASSPRAR